MPNLNFKKISGGFLGTVTSGASALGTAINNNILKRGTKLGGDAAESNLIKQEAKQFEKKGKAGTYARLEDEMKPSQTINLDSYMQKNHGHLLKPEVTPTLTPTKINLFTPVKNILDLKPQNIFSSKFPELDITQANRPNSIVEALQRTELERNNAGTKIGTFVKRKPTELDYIGYRKEFKRYGGYIVIDSFGGYIVLCDQR